MISSIVIPLNLVSPKSITSSSPKPKVFRLSFPPSVFILPLLLYRACPITFPSLFSVPSILKLRFPFSFIVISPSSASRILLFPSSPTVFSNRVTSLLIEVFSNPLIS